jgi:precorrin-2 dehydrogenase/sirohydrochlorin ferrochelatase
VVVIGGGEIAERKIEGLLEAGARVTVVSPDVTRRIEAWAAAGAVALERRRYETGDLSDSALAYAATDDEAANRAVGEEAEAKGIWLNVVDRPERCGFFAPAVVRRGDLSIAISTNGASPALARRLREKLEQQLGPEYARALKTLRAERRRLLREEPDPARRREALEALLDALGLP